MGIVIYSSEAEMPKHLRKEKQDTWNTLDQAEWDIWNYTPTDTPQKSKFNSHVTWNSHRTDYFNNMNVKIAEEEAAKTRIAIDNKFGSAASYAQELKDAEEEEARWEAEEAAEAKAAEEAKAFEALQAELAANEFTNTILPTPEPSEPYKPFTKLSEAEKAKRRKIHNRKTYLKRKAEGKTQTKLNKDAAYEFCEFCGGEFKDTPAGRSNHRQTQIHTTKVLSNNICNHYIKKYPNVKTMERAERVLANKIKESELSLCVKYTPITLKNKYKRLWAQYSS